MQVSGYDQAFRLQVVKSAIHAYRVKQENERNGGTPVYRSRSWRRHDRRREKEKKKKEWYKKGGKQSVMFVPATPDSKLRNQIQEEASRKGFSIKVVEKSGTRLVSLLKRNDPFKQRGCRDEERCMICKGGGNGGCRDSGVTYVINCLGDAIDDPREKCDAFYQGETDRNGYSRGTEHENDLQNQKDTSALWKHCVTKHNSVKQEFMMSITDRVRNDASKRQILEAVRIQRSESDKMINGRSEWNSTSLPRLTVTSNEN